MTPMMIVVLIMLLAGFILVLGLLFALSLDIKIVPGLCVAGACVFAATLAGLPFLHYSGLA